MSPRRRKPDDDPHGLADALARWDSAQDWMRQRDQTDPATGQPDDRGHAAPGELFAERVPGQPAPPSGPGGPPGPGSTGQWSPRPPEGWSADPRGQVPPDPRSGGWSPAGQPTPPGGPPTPPGDGPPQPPPDLTQVIRPNYESTPWGGPAWGGGQPPAQPGAPDDGQPAQPAVPTPPSGQRAVPPPPPGPDAGGQHAIPPAPADSGRHAVQSPPAGPGPMDGPDSGQHPVTEPGSDSGQYPPAAPDTSQQAAVGPDSGQHPIPPPATDPGHQPAPHTGPDSGQQPIAGPDSGPAAATVPAAGADPPPGPQEPTPAPARPDTGPASGPVPAAPPGPSYPEHYPPAPGQAPYQAVPPGSQQGWPAPPAGPVEGVPPGLQQGWSAPPAGPVEGVPPGSQQGWSAPPVGPVEGVPPGSQQGWPAAPAGQVEQWPAAPVPAGPPAEWQRQGWTEPGQRGAPSAADLASHALVRTRKPTPSTGWRKAVYALSGHALNPGESPADVRRRELLARATMPVRGCYRIAMISLKGGVGKTTMSVCLGSTLASLRGDRVIAVDANPDRGTLSGKIPLETVATIRNLLNDADGIGKYSDVRRYTSQSPDRLEVLASETDPAVSTAFSESDYHVVAGILERFYNVVITDCGTGLLHSAMTGVLALANQLVVVSSGSVDGARSASATLDWLEAHGRGDMVARTVAVINSVRPKSGGVDLDKLREHFAARCREVTCIPYDPHLEEGAEVDLSQLRAETRNALLEFSAYVADGFPRP